MTEPANEKSHGAGVPLLSAQSLQVGYGAVPVLRDVSLEVRPGEVVALLGPNGAGKTTTLLALAGEIPIQAGRVQWMGEDLRGSLHQRARAGIGLLTEERSVFMKLTVRDNLRLGRGSVEAAVSAMPELERLLDRRAGLLSGGEQQILTLARALSSDFKLLLVDEISLGLAPIIVRRLLQDLRKAAISRGLGVLLVEQQVAAALEVTDRAIVLRRGRVELEGDSESLRQSVDLIRDVYL